MKGCQLLILDIDGVLTNGTKMYDINGNVISKSFNDRDFTAIKRFKDAGVAVCFLSGDNRVNEAMARTRKVDFYYTRPEGNPISKGEFVEIFADAYGIATNKMIYVGDDFYDLSIIEKLDLTYCPADSCACVREAVRLVLDTSGGMGVVAELYDIYEQS